MDQMREWMVARHTNSQCESPMESLFWAGWMLMRPTLMLGPGAFLQEKSQEKVGNYRADFLFKLKDKEGAWKSLVVEVDGHDFHERTKQQAAHDKARDRWMTGANYQVMRFTGSEVYANPLKCALDVADRLYQLHYGVSRKEAIVRAGIESIRRMLEED